MLSIMSIIFGATKKLAKFWDWRTFWVFHFVVRVKCVSVDMCLVPLCNNWLLGQFCLSILLSFCHYCSSCLFIASFVILVIYLFFKIVILCFVFEAVIAGVNMFQLPQYIIRRSNKALITLKSPVAIFTVFVCIGNHKKGFDFTLKSLKFYIENDENRKLRFQNRLF